MSTSNSPQPETLAELVSLTAKHCPEDGIHPTVLESLHLIRASHINEPMPVLYAPALCIIVQGSKHAILGGEVYRYDPHQYLVVSVDLPVIGQVIEATPDKPYLCLRLDLNVLQIGELMRETRLSPLAEEARRGLYLSRLDNDLLDPLLRLLRLLDTRQDMPVLGPLVEREIFYRLLQGEQSSRLRQIAVSDSQTQRISRVIDALKRNFSKPVRMEELAREVHMSVSGLHHNFKKVTAMSPLQYQKRLRLLEARRLLMGETGDITSVCHQVGYESPSQFSREYSRLFGLSPSRDMKRLATAE